MPEYLAPGTYVEEVPGDVVPIQGVGTSTAGFVGPTERGPLHATLVTSWLEYQRWYGDVGDPSTFSLPMSVQGFFINGGQRAFIARVVPAKWTKPATLALGSLTASACGPGPWGGRIAVRVKAATRDPKGFALRVAYYRDQIPERPNPEKPDKDEPLPTVVEDYDELSADPTNPRFAESVVNSTSHLLSLTHDETKPPAAPSPSNDYQKLKGDNVTGPVTMTSSDFQGSDDPLHPTGLRALAGVDEVSILAVPDAVNQVLVPDKAQRSDLVDKVIGQCENLRDRFAVLDIARGAGDIGANWRNYLPSPSMFAAVYYPHVRVVVPSTGATVLMPASGFIAGVYANNDITRGVHKAPANYELRGILTQDVRPGEGPLEYSVSKAQQGILNPVGINVIRDFRSTGSGVRVWGARTISTDPDWRYINVRRLFNFVEESVDKGLQWVVFEPNSEPTWARVRRTVSTFLDRVWRDGALMGDSREQAYFVRCDSSTMTQDDILNGRLICLIGIAPVRPAEFVILRFSQKTIEAGT